MVAGETSRRESPELGGDNIEVENPVEKETVRALDAAITVKEKEAEQEPSWLKKHKKGLLITGGVLGGGAAGIHYIPTKFLLIPFAKFILVPLFMFTKRMIEKKGNITFRDGMEIANRTFGIFGLGEKKKI